MYVVWVLMILIKINLAIVGGVMQPLQLFLGSLDDYGHSILQHHGSHSWDIVCIWTLRRFIDAAAAERYILYCVCSISILYLSYR